MLDARAQATRELRLGIDSVVNEVVPEQSAPRELAPIAELMPFAGCPNAIWARPRAVAFEVAAALKTAERRVQIAADERAFSGERSIF